MTNQKSKFIIFFIIGLVLFPFAVLGAELYLEPAEGEYQPGDIFIMEIRINTEDECINAANINLGFNQDILEAIDFSKGDSFLTLWIEEPNFSNQTNVIFFSGGIPGGYCGQIPGDPGESNLLGKIIFKVRETDAKLERETDAKLAFLENSQVLLNDGLGTPCELTFKGATFNILAKSFDAAQGRDQWQEELRKDKISPELFEIKIQQDPLIFEGKYFIIFQTQDKQTGIDYYEVKEGDKNWQRTKSPYLLVDQELKSIIKVRAVDKAGNEQLAEYIPEIPGKPFPYWLVILISFGIIVYIWRKIFKK
jgi:hypothetical protein